MKAELKKGEMFRANSGTVGINLSFKNQEQEWIKWTGWLSEKAKDATILKLIEAGFIGESVHDVVDTSCWVSKEFTLGGLEKDQYGWTASWLTEGKKVDKEAVIQEFEGFDFSVGDPDHRLAVVRVSNQHFFNGAGIGIARHRNMETFHGLINLRLHGFGSCGQNTRKKRTNG